jgi:endo-1,4-beta-xylanase
MHFTQVFTALALAGSALAAPPKYEAPKPKPQPQGLATAMKARGREFIGTALTLRGNATEEAIARNGADFNSFVICKSFNCDFED